MNELLERCKSKKLVARSKKKNYTTGHFSKIPWAHMLTIMQSKRHINTKNIEIYTKYGNEFNFGKRHRKTPFLRNMNMHKNNH